MFDTIKKYVWFVVPALVGFLVGRFGGLVGFALSVLVALGVIAYVFLKGKQE